MCATRFEAQRFLHFEGVFATTKVALRQIVIGGELQN